MELVRLSSAAMNVTMTFLSGFAMGVALLCCAAAGKAQAVSFLRYVDVPIGPGCCRIASADFNGDGRVDLVVSSDSGLALLPGNGDGSFKPKIDLLPRGILVAVADINRDGWDDFRRLEVHQARKEEGDCLDCG